MSVNQLILGDNLEILKKIEDNSVDLIYLDPPFFSNKNYEVIWGDEGEVRSFQDRWSGGMSHYLDWLNERVKQMHRILKDTGSLYLHCDWHADAYIRVEILDKIFGENNFRNEIIWGYQWGGVGKQNFARKHDNIYWYCKSNKWTFNEKEMREPYTTKDKRWHNNKEGKLLRDLWDDIPIINTMSKERIGYPTQKPEALLERIIKASSNEGDVVLDPFMGGGTTIAVANKLNRKWIGIDQSVAAVKVTEMRLNNQQELFSPPFTVQLHKYDYDTLRNSNAFAFESWIIQQFGGVSNTKQRNDYGLDGKMPDDTPIQAKRSDGIGRNVIDNFKSAIERNDKRLFEKNKAEGKPVGYVIAFSFGRGAVEEVARLKMKENIIIKLVTVEEVVPIAKKPTLSVKVNELPRDAKGICEIEFIATGQSDAGIEFYSWDFNYDAEKGFRADIMIDKEGRQTLKLKAGTHIIAAKVSDNDGLDSVEVIKLKVNGAVERE